MVEYKLKVSMTCKTCNGLFYSSIPDEMIIQGPPNTKPVKITIEEMKSYVKKDVFDLDGKPVGTLETKDHTFDITHPKCNSKNKYSVSDFTFLPS